MARCRLDILLRLTAGLLGLAAISCALLHGDFAGVLALRLR
jgi:hypothetical protein